MNCIYNIINGRVLKSECRTIIAIILNPIIDRVPIWGTEVNYNSTCVESPYVSIPFQSRCQDLKEIEWLKGDL